MIAEMDNAWTTVQNAWSSGGYAAAIKPIVPVVWAANPATPAEVAAMVNAVTGDATPATVGGYSGVSFWDADTHTSAIGTPSKGPSRELQQHCPHHRCGEHDRPLRSRLLLFHLRNTNSAGTDDEAFGFGAAGAGWEPLAGDWNGDGVSGVGLYDPKASEFYLTNSFSTGYAQETFGFDPAGWIPIAGDWTGDGITPSASTIPSIRSSISAPPTPPATPTSPSLMGPRAPAGFRSRATGPATARTRSASTIRCIRCFISRTASPAATPTSRSPSGLPAAWSPWSAIGRAMARPRSACTIAQCHVFPALSNSGHCGQHRRLRHGRGGLGAELPDPGRPAGRRHALIAVRRGADLGPGQRRSIAGRGCGDGLQQKRGAGPKCRGPASRPSDADLLSNSLDQWDNGLA